MENTIENLPTSEKKNSARRNAESHFVAWERRTALVKQQASAESAASDAKTIRLKALRLAKEAANMEAAPQAPKRVKRKAIIKA